MSILLEILKKKGVSVTDFAKESGIKKDNVYAWKAERGSPKAEDSEKIQKWIEINTDLPDVNYSNATKRETESVLNEPSSVYKKSEMKNADEKPAIDRNEESLHSLIKSNAVLVDTNRDLTDMLKQSITNSNSHQHISVTLEPLLHRLAEGGVGRFWKDYDAGRIELNKLLLSTSSVGEKLGI